MPRKMKLPAPTDTGYTTHCYICRSSPTRKLWAPSNLLLHCRRRRERTEPQRLVHRDKRDTSIHAPLPIFSLKRSDGCRRCRYRARATRSRVRRRPRRRGNARRGDNGARYSRRCCLLARLQVRKTEEVQRVRGVLRHSVADTLSKDSLEERTISGVRVSRLRLIRNVADGGLSVSEHVRPLFDLFPKVLGV